MSPVTAYRLWFEYARMVGEAQMVIAMRVAGMAGFWSMAPSEMTRMVAEKQKAAVESLTKATQAAASGKPPETVVHAALRPVARRTRANVKRLAKRGPSVPGKKR
ncbi:antibiotic ABC transporter [Thioclava sp. 'Guangxiensis']|uniref:hypothetical protein n=1 Tax=Thioclava sp. 'Guangxiensis' TaxID=3149044 RepID=UPI0038783BEC